MANGVEASSLRRCGALVGLVLGGIWHQGGRLNPAGSANAVEVSTRHQGGGTSANAGAVDLGGGKVSAGALVGAVLVTPLAG